MSRLFLLLHSHDTLVISSSSITRLNTDKYLVCFEHCGHERSQRLVPVEVLPSPRMQDQFHVISAEHDSLLLNCPPWHHSLPNVPAAVARPLQFRGLSACHRPRTLASVSKNNWRSRCRYLQKVSSSSVRPDVSGNTT